MANKAMKNDGPACACGKVDLYMESLKQQEKSKKSVADSSKHTKPDKQEDAEYSAEK